MFELTPRQTQIISLKAKGAAHKEIAIELDISPRTVEEHLNNIVKRLNAKNATHAVSLAISQGHIAPEIVGMTPAKVDEYLESQTDKFQLHVLRELLAHHVIGHSNFDEFSENELNEFNERYLPIVEGAEKRKKAD